MYPNSSPSATDSRIIPNPLSPFAQLAKNYVAAGYSPLPVVSGTKKVMLRDWPNYCHKQPTERQLLKWARNHRWGNIGLALGFNGLVAIDVDDDRFDIRKIVASVLQDSPIKKLGRTGFTAFYFASLGDVETSSLQTWDETLINPKKGDLGGMRELVGFHANGRQTVIPPSIHPDTRKPYQWGQQKTLLDVKPSDLPAITQTDVDRLKAALQPFVIEKPREASKQRPVPQLEQSKVVPSGAALDWQEIDKALGFLSADEPRPFWIKIGQCLHDAGWGSDDAYDKWDAWSATSSSKYQGKEETRRTWGSFGKRSGLRVTLATLFYEAAKRGYKRPEREGEIDWPKRIRDRADPKSIDNLQALLSHLGLHLYVNMMSGAIHIVDDASDTELSDKDEARIWSEANNRGFRVGSRDLHTMVLHKANQTLRHHVREFLSTLQWDGIPRLDNWLSVYCGAQPTPLHAEFGARQLIAAVRRVRKPGTKHDAMLVFEGPQGAGKSTVTEILGGEFHALGVQLGHGAKETIELSRGKWILEVAEMTGIGVREIDSIKDQITRTHDRARLAFDRYTSDIPRQFVFFGTVNDAEYLRDTTGNRRFWPVSVGKIDEDALRRDRDHLWAEAAAREAHGERHTLAPALYEAAAEAQQSRVIEPPMLVKLRDLLGTDAGGERIHPAEIHAALKVSETMLLNHRTSIEIGHAMQAVGFKPKQMRLSGKQVRVYQRPNSNGGITVDVKWDRSTERMVRMPLYGNSEW